MLGEFIDNLDGRKSIIEIIYNYQEENVNVKIKLIEKFKIKLIEFYQFF